MKKDNLGITLISLVITIIILLILSSITVYTGINTIHSAKLTRFTTELKIMQQKVNELYDSYTNNKSVIVNGTEYTGIYIQNIGQELDDIDVFNTNKLEEIFSENGSGITDRTGYMYYNAETIKALGLEDMEYEFFVNIEKRSIVSTEGYNDYGKIYYTLDQVPDGVYNVEYNKINNNVTFKTITKVQNGQGKIQVVDINSNEYVNKWQIQYRIKAEEGNSENLWTISEEFTGNEFTIDVPIENLLKDYEIQIFHGDEIISEVKTLNVLRVGDYINYNPQIGAVETSYMSYETENGYGNQLFNLSSYQFGWRVLGIDEETNQILLVSEDFIGPDNEEYLNSSYGRTYYYLKGQLGYKNGQSELDNISKLYGQGKGASGARSITARDVNKLTEYEPITGGTNVSSYGNKITYTKNAETGQIHYSGNDGIEGILTQTTFIYYNKETEEWKTLESGESVTLESSYYYYTGEEQIGSNSSEIYKMLFTNSENSVINNDYKGTTTGCEYWLASPFTYMFDNGANLGLRYVTNGVVDIYGLYSTNDSSQSKHNGVRPVVSLNSDINILEGRGTLEAPYQIQ